MKKRWISRGVLLTTSLLSLSIPWTAASVGAASKNIRVALFVDTGQGYRGVVPTVTLTSNKGLELKLSGKEGSVSLPVLETDMLRFRVDEFFLQVTETTDLTKAQQIAQQLSQRKLDAVIQMELRGGNPLYQVVSGTYDSYQAVATQAKLVSQAIGIQPEIKGPYRLEAGTFATLREAQDWETAFEVSGVPAHTVLRAENKKLTYAVWIGDEASKEGLSALAKTAAAAFPNFSYRKPSERSYAVIKKDVVTGGDTETVWKYVFSPEAKIVATPKKTSGVPLIGVEERDRREYRGSIELSEYKGNLTVVNELPMEQYLYGVVGSEMATGWPLEALKTQAVLARTRAVSQGNKYGIANLSDTTFEQVYFGYGREADDIRKAVNQTADEIIKYKGKVTESFFYSNAGGLTSDGSEVWGNPVPYLKSVMSDDTSPMEKANIWYLISLQDGTIGYVRNDFVTLTGNTNPLGLQTAIVTTENLNFRSGPSTTYHRVLSTLPVGSEITIINQEPEENAFSWTRGPYTANEVTAMINVSQDRSKAPRLNGPTEWLRVTERGPSGRVMQMEANGMGITVSSPDAHRSIFRQGESGLRSTKFDVEEMGTYSVLGANGQNVAFPQASYGLQVLGGDENNSVSANGYSSQFLIYRGTGEWRTASKEQAFLFRGNGFGHGLGVSQFGAKAMAENGYDYKGILQHYYTDVTIER